MALSSVLTPIFGETGFGLNLKKIWDQTKEIVLVNWHLGVTAFGGPAVHFQIFRRKFVDQLQWIDEQTPWLLVNAVAFEIDQTKYQELFAVTNSLPGPASTKMLFTINTLRGGFYAGVLVFLLWSIPSAIGMLAFSLGVSRIGDKLPEAVYALLTGLNAATVGIIALAAMQLAHKVITDKLTRALVFLGAAAGMLYSALWYFPILMIIAGLTTILSDFKILPKLVRLVRPRQRHLDNATELEESRAGIRESQDFTPHNAALPIDSQQNAGSSTGASHHFRHHHGGQNITRSNTPSLQETTQAPEHSQGPSSSPESNVNIISWRIGLAVLALFFASFLAILLVRGLYKSPPRVFSLFANLFLAGTIIFGGGPVVIPLLHEYVVVEGWVSPRNFLLGLALIQAFPGPNFNFAVYLGALAVAGRSSPIAGAAVAFIGIFLPGLVIQSAFMGFWGSVRKNRVFLSALRGVNAGAVGLVFTAVYRLWQIGFLDQKNQEGQPLGGSPWWVVVTATSFVGGSSFGLNPPSAVVLGGIMGMIWFGVAKH